MKALVTGGAGFIGSHTVDALIQKGMDVTILDNLQKPVHLKGKPNYLNPKAKFVHGDIRDKEIMIKCLKDVTYVFHFAAYQDYLPDFSTFFSVNSVGTALIYEIIVEKKLPVEKVIVASSQFVNGEGVYKSKTGKFYYPKRRMNEQLKKGQWHFTDVNGELLEWQWTDEEYACPPNQYAISKYSQELMAMNLGERYGIPSVTLRYSIVQGARQSFYNAYSGVCRIFSLHYFFGRPPTIYEDGLMHRDFVNIHDVVDANILVMEDDRANGKVFCVGGGKAYTVIEFAETVAKVYNKEDIRPRITGEYRFGDTRNACSDISKIRKLGWESRRTIEDNILEYKEYLEEQKNIKNILDFAEKNMKSLNVIRKAII